MQCKSILIVEDDGDIRNCIRDVLELEGYKTFTATNGQEGLEQLRLIEPPCLVLLDLMMPVMNGWDFLKEKRNNVTIAPIPVFVISAAGERAKGTGATGFIKKPIDLEVLLKVVREYCGEAARSGRS